jgi:hypothetical protein
MTQYNFVRILICICAFGVFLSIIDRVGELLRLIKLDATNNLIYKLIFMKL